MDEVGRAERLADHIVDEARKAQDDRRYGPLTNPFILGLLTAAEIIKGDTNG